MSNIILMFKKLNFKRNDMIIKFLIVFVLPFINFSFATNQHPDHEDPFVRNLTCHRNNLRQELEILNFNIEDRNLEHQQPRLNSTEILFTQDFCLSQKWILTSYGWKKFAD